jgi:hypothetical protein
MTISVTSPVEDEVKKWLPNPKQEKFIRLPFDIFEAFYGGQKGPGKSEILVLLPILYGFHNNPNYRGLFMRRTYADIEREILDRQRKYYPSTGAVLNEQKKRWKWPNGAIDRLGHAETEQGVREYDTDEYHLLRWDELTHFLPFQYQYLCFTRVRSSDPFLPAIVRSAGNPGNIGNTWVHKRFIKPAPFGFKRLRERIWNPAKNEWQYLERIFIPAELTDNPKIDPSYILKLQLLPEAERRAAFGDWNAFLGQVFTEWRLAPFRDEPDNACHITKEFEIPTWWPRVISIDWGWDAATAILWGAISPTGRIYIYRVYNEKYKYIKDWTRDLSNLSRNEINSIRRIVICHSAGQQRGEPKTIQEQVNESLLNNGFPVQCNLGKRDRVGGKMLIHEYLRWKTIDAKVLEKTYNERLANAILRNYGQERFEAYNAMFVPEVEDNLPKLQLFEHGTEELQEVIPTCQYEQKEHKNSEDVAEFKGDDLYDALRGLLESVDDYVREARDEFTTRAVIDKIVGTLNATGDTTQFYRQMEIAEAASSSKGFGVRRYHRRVSR